MDRREEILRIFPRDLRDVLSRVRTEFQDLEEIRLRAEQPVFLRIKGREWILGEQGELEKPGCLEGQAEGWKPWICSARQLKETVEYMGSYSLYAAEDELRQGFITIQGGHRIGVAGRVVADRQQIRLMKFISFINVRVAHEIKGCADWVMPWLCQRQDGGWRFLNTLIISPPRCGKTTLLRDIIRQISRGWGQVPGMTVGVVDERSELGACWQGVPQNDLGPRTDVLDCCPKAQGMMMLVRSMSPQVVAADEIGSREDAQAVSYIRSCGCSLAATVHGTSLEDLYRKPVFCQMAEAGDFQRLIVLGCSSQGFQGTVLDRQGRVLGKKEGESA